MLGQQVRMGSHRSRYTGYREEDTGGGAGVGKGREQMVLKGMLREEPTGMQGAPSWLSAHPHPFTWHESPR